MNDSHSSEPLHGTVIDLFDQWTKKSPERVAAERQGKSLTYGALHDASLHVSRALLLAGVLPRARAPLLTQMSLEILPPVIGILRVGSCYVPIDVAAWSRVRIEAALSEPASPVAVITSPCPGLQLPTITHSKELEDAAAQGGARSQGCHASDGLAIRLPRGNNDCQSLNLTPSMLAALEPSGSYDHVRYIFLGAYAPKLDVGRRWITKNRKVFTMYGPSETICVISFIGELHPAQEVPFGELIPGVKVVWGDEEMKESNHGKDLISGPGDLARTTEDGQLIWAGRADSLVKNRGFLINLETEVEPAIQAYPQVNLSVAFQCHADPFVIPDIIFAMDSFPLNVNSETDRLALQAQLDEKLGQDDDPDKGASVLDTDSLMAYDALYLAFSWCLQIRWRKYGLELVIHTTG
ncbi:hypothetical protein KXW97_008739 [Aspergillus fumigatus]|nr:hypothetical protein KXW47_004738 [Aspergillus fumigatus]KAH2532841.1 hypothetical protein KXW97_008739 [Aspergillus fumigatus]KAH3547611.1 hypothetical protein KXW20_005949 [Aspergillus fumigatus]